MTDQDSPAGAAPRLLYPALPGVLSAADLHRLYSPSYDERQWAPLVARTLRSQVALLVQLKTFQSVGRFLSMADIPLAAAEHIARRLSAPLDCIPRYARATVYRHREAVLEYLKVTGWGVEARDHALCAMRELAETRTDPADLINAAVDSLIRNRYELPALMTLRRLAGTVHNAVNTGQWKQIISHLSEAQRAALENLLAVNADTHQSSFADLCRSPGPASRKNLTLLISRYQWLLQLPNPSASLACVATSKILQWANEARRLKAKELREYVVARRHALLLAVIYQARGQVLDDLTQMLLRLARKIERKSHERLTEFYESRRNETDTLIRAFRDVLIVFGDDTAPALKVAHLDQILAAAGGRRALEDACTELLRHEKQNWRPFARQSFIPMRSTLLQLAAILPLQSTPETDDLLRLVAIAAAYEAPYYDHYSTDIPTSVLPRYWRPIVLDDPTNPNLFNRRQLEVAAVLELASSIRAGETFVTDSLSFDRFWDRLPSESADPSAIAAYALERKWGEGASGFVRALKDALEREAMYLERAVGDGKAGFMRRGKDGRPVVTPIRSEPIPTSAIALQSLLMERMPERQILAAIANTEHWTRWSKHFGPPSRIAPQIKEPNLRYVLTAFAYGCGLGPAQTARHLNGAISADQLSFADRRHVDIADLRAASADIINMYAQFELPRQWGLGDAAVADGTHFETFEDNLLAERHIRYGKTGGIAYRHIADNYVALFSRFIACGTYEATYILDALLKNLSDLRPRRVHADTHGQSVAVFGLAYLLGIELMPRIRRWKHLRLYRPDRASRYAHIDSLFSENVNWPLIEEQYGLFMQLALSIQSGGLAPSAVLARVNSYSTRNRFSLALQELGKAVRTKFLLQWIQDDSMRRTVHKCTTKIERHHQFAKHLAFGGEGLLKSNNPADQEKAVVYNELVANAVVLQNVVDQTRALRELRSEGATVDYADLTFLSPYATSKLKRFGDYPTEFVPDPRPEHTSLMG